ncbi:MAG TPA: alpha/beta fold hydrolase [Kineosporiaceae bacterium]|nr:alpha/beta fold hydrolase [Kineosporiaceae bacterium]
MTTAPDVRRRSRAALDLLTAAPTHRAAGLAVTRTGREPGSAPALLLVHGLGSARSVWAPVLPELADRYDVIVVDLPGHGASPPLAPGEDRIRGIADRLAGSCAELGVRRPHVAGNSLGGWAGLELAADGNAASLTALAPAGLRREPTLPSPILLLNRRLAKLTGSLADPLIRFGPVRALVFASGTVDPWALDLGLARAAARAVRESTGYETLLASASRTRFERAATIEVPVTIVTGESDRILPGQVNRCRELAPAGARWVSLPRCGHAPMWDAPERTVELVDETVAAAEEDLTAQR